MGPGRRPLLCGLLSGILLVLSSGAHAGSLDASDQSSCTGPDMTAVDDGPPFVPDDGPTSICPTSWVQVAEPDGDAAASISVVPKSHTEATGNATTLLGRLPVELRGAGDDSGQASSGRPDENAAEEPQARPKGETRSDGRRPADTAPTDSPDDETEGPGPDLDLVDPLATVERDAFATLHDPLDALRSQAGGLLEEVERTHLPHPDLDTSKPVEDDPDRSPASTMPVVERGVPDAVVASLFVLGGALATGGLVGLGGGKTLLGRVVGPLRRLAWLATLPLFSKIAKDDVLEHPIRDRLVEAIRNTPGITVQQLRTRFELGYGTIVHHMRVLEHHHIVSSIREGRHRRLFLVGQVDHSDRPKAALLANPKTGRIYALLTARPGLTQKDLARSARVGGSTIHWHINRLRDAGLVEVRRDGRSIHYFPALKIA